jgi:hypothetical protein
VLAEFVDALEGMGTNGADAQDEPARPSVNSAADSELLSPLTAAVAWPTIDSAVANTDAAGGTEADAEKADAEKPAADRSRQRPKKKGRTTPIQDEWGLFDPEQCGFAALLAKLDQMDDPPPQKRRR